MTGLVTGSLTSVRVAGGLLPPDVLAAVPAGGLDGMSSGDYHLAGESPREATARVWTHLVGVYRRFRADLGRLPEDDPAVGLTRERWLTALLSELGYGRVPQTGPGGLTIGDKQYPLSHLWGATPVHLLGWGVPLDKRTPGVAGGAQRAPHAMVQELLNRSEPHLWAIVSNGRVLRLLRDSTTLTGQAYIEFDLEAMFDGELFSEFALLFLLAHESRVEVPDGGRPADCWLERWRLTAVSQGVRALALLRAGVQQAMGTLGTGFLQHPANTDLRRRLESGTIRLDDVHQSLLRMVYRLLFWAVAEDRDGLLDPQAEPAAAKRYSDYFSSARLRRLAVRRHGTAHDDLWDAVTVILTALARPDGEPRLALHGLGGLFSTTEADVLTGARLGNRPLLAAIRSLSVVQPKGQPRRSVDFRHLGAEELGSIYESLLELVPRRDPVAQIFTLETLAGNDRKKSGSYYTPSDLVELVLDTALDPVLDDAEKTTDPETALLAVTVCDPAIGSGHFMVAAARRIATRLATARTGEVDPTPTTVQDAMHDVVARCIYGVDVNPMAADLAKISLWLEAMSPGRPLSFLDHHIKVGNSLLGTTPALMRDGIPDTAYLALTGDDKGTVRAWKALNEKQRGAQISIFEEGQALHVGNAELAAATREVADRAEAATSVADVAWAAQRYATHQTSADVVRARRAADAWCAAFLAPKRPGDLPITQDVLGQLRAGTAAADVVAAVAALATRHRLFHWHLEFPEIFSVPDHDPANNATGWTGGFSCVVGNPPWVAHAGRAAQPLPLHVPILIQVTNPAFNGYRTTHGAFVRRTAEIAREGGRLGLILPTSVADLDGYKATRVAHDQLATVAEPLPTFGDGAFADVFQPCMALLSIRSASGYGSATPHAWQLRREDLVPQGLALMAHLQDCERLPSEMFAELGLQTTATTRQLLVDGSRRTPDMVPILEGRDVVPYGRPTPRVWIPRSVVGGRLQRLASIPVLVRQTARFPMAASSPKMAFRNSLLAGIVAEPWTESALIGLLNSRLIRWHHYNRFRDAREGMPQVKISHLRCIPLPKGPLSPFVHQVSEYVSHITSAGREGDRLHRESLNQYIEEAYGLSQDHMQYLQRWASDAKEASIDIDI